MHRDIQTHIHIETQKHTHTHRAVKENSSNLAQPLSYGGLSRVEFCVWFWLHSQLAAEIDDVPSTGLAWLTLQ